MRIDLRSLPLLVACTAIGCIVHDGGAPPARIIPAAIAAARSAAPPEPSRARTSARPRTTSLRRAGSASSGHAASASRAPVTSPWISSGTIERPATMFGSPM